MNLVSTAGGITLNASGATAITNNATVGGTLGVTGNFAINTNKFNVTALSGNTTIAGTLGVTSDLAINTNKFNVNSSSGTTSLAGDLFVGSATQVGGISQIGSSGGNVALSLKSGTSSTSYLGFDPNGSSLKNNIQVYHAGSPLSMDFHVNSAIRCCIDQYNSFAVRANNQTHISMGDTTHATIQCVNNADTRFLWYDTSQSSNNKIWDFFQSGTTLTLRTVNDAFNASNNIMSVARSGTTVSSVTFTDDSFVVKNSAGSTTYGTFNSSGLTTGNNLIDVSNTNNQLSGKLILADNGTVKQVTSITTGVTLNKMCGIITTVTCTIGASLANLFTVTNSKVASNDIVLATIENYSGSYGANGLPHVNINGISSGSFQVIIINSHPSNALNGGLKIAFMVITQTAII